MEPNYSIKWNSRGCGRCFGTGFYSMSCGSGIRKGLCYDCRGRGYLMSSRTRDNMEAFRAWRRAERPAWPEVLAVLASGRFGKAFKIIKTEAAA